MKIHISASLACVLAGSMICVSVGLAQTFNVKKFDIKGEGGTDYLTAEAGSGRVFVTRSTHVMGNLGSPLCVGQAACQIGQRYGPLLEAVRQRFGPEARSG